MESNKEVYSKLELDNWRNRANQDLITAEKYLIEKYLTDKRKNVIEAGTGGGRIAFNIEKSGFGDIWGFDYVPEMIEYARTVAVLNQSRVHFIHGDAVNLTMINDNQFFYSVYLQQVICFIPYNQINRAIEESYRITAPDGIILFSFLNYDGKKRNKILSFFLTQLRLLRGEHLSPQQLPWLIINHKVNWKFFRKKQPVNYWFRKDEILRLLKKANFQVIETTTSGKILNLRNKNSGMLYIVCRKSSTSREQYPD